MTKFKKNTHLSLSLSLSTCRSVDAFSLKKMCMYQSLSLSLSIYICKNVLDPDQTRMELRKECFVNLKNCACDRKYAKCRTKADAFSVYLNKCIHCPVPCVGAILDLIPRNSQNYQASIQRWAIIGTPAKRHLKAFRWRADDGPLLVIFGSSLP